MFGVEKIIIVLKTTIVDFLKTMFLFYLQINKLIRKEKENFDNSIH